MADDLVEDWWVSENTAELDATGKRKKTQEAGPVSAAGRSEKNVLKKKRKLTDLDAEIVGGKRPKKSDIQYETKAKVEDRERLEGKLNKAKKTKLPDNSIEFETQKKKKKNAASLNDVPIILDTENIAEHQKVKASLDIRKAEHKAKMIEEKEGKVRNKAEKIKVKSKTTSDNNEENEVKDQNKKVKGKNKKDSGSQVMGTMKKKAVKLKNGEDEEDSVLQSDDSAKLAKKKKKKRRSITAALAGAVQKDIPLVPWDLTSRIDAHFAGKLSPVERDELRLTSTQFVECNDLTHTPVSYVRQCAPHWKKDVQRLCVAPGAPLILLVCASGLRAANLIRLMGELKLEEFRFAKLFAKHLKMDAQVKFLRAHRTHMGVGTPNRLLQLIDTGALSLEALRFVVLDWSWRDAKQRRLIDIAQVRDDVMGLLAKALLPRVRAGPTRLGLL